MRSIRMKLFLSIGCIFLAIAFLSFLIPRLFVRKDIDEASKYLNSIYSQYQSRLQKLAKSWVTYRFVQQAAELSAVSQMIQVEKKPLWQIAAFALGQDPNIAIVQVTDNEQETAVISVESATPYTPAWAKDQKGTLWIKLAQERFFRTSALPNVTNTYLLFADPEKESEAKSLTFTPFSQKQEKISIEDPTVEVYDALRLKESHLLEKIKLIQQLAEFKKEASGIMQVDASFKTAMALLSEEIFFSKPVVDTKHPTVIPFILFRKEGPYVDLMAFATQNAPFIVIGYSLSSIASEIAQTIQKPVLIYYKGVLLQGFTEKGTLLATADLLLANNKVVWQNVSYIPQVVSIGEFAFSILVTEVERTMVERVMNRVKDSLITKLSFNLFILSFVLFAIAMLLLARISKRLTKPITQLATASEEIGKGKYQGLDLPPVEKRHDEIATLTRSFQKMVDSLRDREKIRGVLNKVVSKEIASTILSSSIELGGEIRTLTMLFSDIRGFTPLSETMPPQKLISLLNTYMTRMCRIIDETHGVVDKFVGDEIMALYGAPLALNKHAEQAISASLLMMASLREWNKERGEKEPQITVGIGVHTGDAFAGNMGAEDRLNYTVVGANVNLAARLCSVAKPMQILVSETTYRSLENPQKFHFQALPPVTLKGIDTPVSVYEVS